MKMAKSYSKYWQSLPHSYKPQEYNKNGSLDSEVPSYKFDEVKLGNKINHFDKYRREMCAEAVTATVNVLVERQY